MTENIYKSMHMKTIKQIGLLGGTFDPIHQGHLFIAEYTLKKLNLSQIVFIPCKNPSHRSKPQASAGDRLWMVYLSIMNKNKYQIDTIEYREPAPAYTVETLRRLRKQYPNLGLNFIVGMDSFNSLEHWEESDELLKLSHLIVVNRSHYDVNSSPWYQDKFNQHLCDNHTQWQQQTHGLIRMINMPVRETSATQVRQQIYDNQIQQIDVNDKVKTYIKTHRLYTKKQ